MHISILLTTEKVKCLSANVGYLEKTICLRREIRTQKKMQNLRESNIIITFFDKKKT
jgi:hypothetical protein